MKLKFKTVEEFEQFALVVAAGVRARDDVHSGTAIKNEVNVLDRDELHRSVGRHVAADTATDDPHALTTEEQAALSEAAQAFTGGIEGEPDKEPDDVTYDPVQVPDDEPQPEPEIAKPKAKRRTKAQIAADEQAAMDAEGVQAPLTDEQAEAVAPVVADPKPEATSPTAASVTPPNEHLAIYTPELIEQLNFNKQMFDPDRKAHLDEGRKAIEKKGWLAYMATLQGLGLPQNITTFNDEQVQLHRAAISRLVNN